ncbi:nucleotidyltransferase domain-containing protein [Candidatus Woesearchaeota archaeon]|nr:nucleotidyltransferase domain-containing protein [Candidatus Woesearchaeota archaeon]
MIPAKFREIVFELAQELSTIESVVAIILFGSVARGEADSRSDLDILLVLEKKGAKKELNQILMKIGRKYNLTIQSILTDRQFSGLDPNFIENVMKEGIVLYGTRLEVQAGKLRLEPYSLIQYDTTNCPQGMRTRLTRILYGHMTEKEYKRKKYTSKSIGLVQKYNGWKAGMAVIIVPFRRAGIFTKLLKDTNVQYKRTDLWIARV